MEVLLGLVGFHTEIDIRSQLALSPSVIAQVAYGNVNNSCPRDIVPSDLLCLLPQIPGPVL